MSGREFQLTPNRSQEIRAMVAVVDIMDKPRSFTKDQVNSLWWFYDNVADLVDRQEREPR